MFKYRKRYDCKCGNAFKITVDHIEKVWTVRGYDFEGYEYFVTCPQCGERKMVKYSDLPFSVIIALAK